MPLCPVCNQECEDRLSLARHMLHDTSSRRMEHHNAIKQLTGKKEVQLKGEGCLTVITVALDYKERQKLKQNKMNEHCKSRHIARKHLEQKCVLCGSTEELEVDHIDDNPYNHELSNLRYLCFPCHHSKHSHIKFVGINTRADYKRCSFCKKLRICDQYAKFLLCGGCSIKLWYRWKERTKINSNILFDSKNPEFKKWIDLLTF